MLTSRLASYYPERCKAYTFVAIGYSPTSADFDYEASLTATKQALGYETYGYWESVASPHHPSITGSHEYPDSSLKTARKRSLKSMSVYYISFIDRYAHIIFILQLDSWLSLMHPFDPTLWKTDVAVRGTMKAWLLGDKHAPLPSYLTEEVCAPYF